MTGESLFYSRDIVAECVETLFAKWDIVVRLPTDLDVVYIGAFLVISNLFSVVCDMLIMEPLPVMGIWDVSAYEFS